MAAALETVKRTLIGAPRASRQLKHQLLPKWMALPVFSSDPMSSVAYATEEMMLVLVLAGALAFSAVLPLSFGIALLLVIVITSYRQTVRAYPHGGGAYIVARENLGDGPGLTAAAALLIDYTLTVSVSIAAGVAAIASAFPVVAEHKVALALGFVALVTLANLRGVREAGALFAFPTYAFVVTMLTLVGVGVARCTFGECPTAPSAGTVVEPEVAGLGVFLLLRAFSSGATALTGVEAISNGVGAFRYPQSRNAAATLAIMGCIAVPLFLGTSYLAVRTGVVAFEGMTQTVTSQIAEAVFGPGIPFFAVQFVTAAILILAANTAYADFPRLASVLAADRFLPRQFLARGDRLVFSNGVVVLALGACLLLVIFRAEVTQLIQLYVVGVFTSFTLSQAGMVRHWLTTRERGWQRSVAINGVGALTTGVVLVVVSVTKFTGGAWIVLVGIPLVVLGMTRIHRHYRDTSLQLRTGLAEPEPSRPNHVIVVLDRVDESVARAVSYAQSIGPASLRALALPVEGEDVERRWAAMAPEVPLEVLPAGDRPVEALTARLHAEVERRPAAFTTALVTETLSRSWLDVVAKHRLAVRVKSALGAGGDLVVTNVVAPDVGPGPYTIEEPATHHVIVLVSAVHRATMRALAYAQSLQATSVTALSINLASDTSSRILQEWDDWGVRVPLELVDSPFRSLSEAVREHIRELRPDGRATVVTCVLPEFVLSRWYHRPLHNQTALLLKAALLFERGVVTTSIPYRLGIAPDDASA